MPKFFTDSSSISDKIVLTGDNYHHAVNVLRLRCGDEITVCDGSSTDYYAKICTVTESEIICDIIKTAENDREPDIKITLFQALPKGDKLSFICEKSVEAGVFEIAPVKLTRCVVKLSSKEFEKKRERLLKIALSAAKQCGRGIIPKVSPLTDLGGMLKRKDEFDLFLFPYELEEKATLKSKISNFKGKSIALAIGPEGGFAPSEAAEIIESGITPVSLGKRILRTETAGIAAIFNILYETEKN